MFRGIRIAKIASAAPWVAALVLFVACGDTKSGSKNTSPTGSAGSAGEEATGGGPTGGANEGGTANHSGSGGTGASTVGGNSAGAGANGTSGNAGATTTSLSGGAGGSAGNVGSAGAAAGGAGGAAGSPGDGGTAGFPGHGGAAGSAGDASSGGSAANDGDSCDTPLIVSEPLVLRGNSFPDDYTATFALNGSGCAGFGDGREMVLQVDLDAGEAVAVRQFGDSQTALSITTACASDAACLVSTDALYGHEETGIHYWATDATTVFVIVDLIGGGISWDYNVFVEFPDSLGVVAGGDPIPDVVVTGNDPNREVRVLEFTEQVQLRGSIDVGGSAAYLWWSLVDPEGAVVESFTATGDDSFGPFNVPAGEYRVVVGGTYPETMTVAMTAN